MFERFKEHLSEVIAVADGCPERYQGLCFQALANALAQADLTASTGLGSRESDHHNGVTQTTPSWLERYGVTVDEVSRVLHWDGSSYNIIARDLKAKATAQKQIRLALLLGAQDGMSGSEPLVRKDTLIEACKQYSAYDISNFSSNMKSRRNFFLARGNDWVLTVPGREQAAILIKELAQ